MNEPDTRQEQLLRMVGEERNSHPADLVKAAERELARRAGGTRRQALVAIGKAGVFLAFLGLLLLGIVAGAAGGLFGRGDRGEDIDEYAAAGVAAILGLAALSLGVAVLLRRGRLFRWARYIPFVRAQDVEAAAREPDTAELLRAIGAARSQTPPDKVNAAEGELRERLQEQQVRLRERVKSWGTSAAALGGFGLFYGVTAGIVLALQVAANGFEYYDGMACAILALAVIVGAALLAGGLGLRRHRNRGRGAVLWAVWAWAVGGLAVSLCAVPSTLSGDVARASPLLTLAGEGVGVAFWVVVVWRITGALCLPEVKEVCGVETPLPHGLWCGH